MLVNIIHKQHLELRELFMQHQEFLLQGRFGDALVSIGDFDICQQAHAQLEERYLFPVFAKIERQSRWDVSLYEKEHEKIASIFETIANDLYWLSEQQLTDSQTRRNIIALLDKEKTFKGLTEHHEEREEEAMLKELDEKLDVKQIKQLVSDIKYTWAEVIGGIKHISTLSK
jgi:hypothetical protein